MKSKAPCDKRLEDLTRKEFEELLQVPGSFKKVLDRSYGTGGIFVILMTFWFFSYFWNIHQDDQIKTLQEQCTCGEKGTPEVPEDGK